jgi:hypothetical protein
MCRWLINRNRIYLGTKSQKESIDKERKREEWEIDNLVEQEKQEIRQSIQTRDSKPKY